MNAVASPPAPFRVNVVRDRDEVVVAPAGELDLASAAMLEREIRGLPGDVERVVVDLSGIEFMDSTGLRMLLSVRNGAKRERRRLLVVPGPAGVQRLFELTGTRGLFDWTAPPAG